MVKDLKKNEYGLSLDLKKMNKFWNNRSNVGEFLTILTERNIKCRQRLTILDENDIDDLSHNMKLKLLHQECCRILTQLDLKIRDEQVDFTEYTACCGNEPIRFLFKCQTSYHDFDCVYRDGCASCGGLLDG